jgi:hypothetical protein
MSLGLSQSLAQLKPILNSDFYTSFWWEQRVADYTCVYGTIRRYQLGSSAMFPIGKAGRKTVAIRSPRH